MSAADLRRVVIALGAVGFVLGVVVQLTVWPSAEDASVANLLLQPLLTAAVLLVMFGVSSVVIARWAGPRRPPRFVAGPAGFVVPPAPLLASGPIMLITCSGLVPVVHMASLQHPLLAVAAAASLVGVIWGVALIIVHSWPTMVLDSGGLTVYGLIGEARVAWDELLPGGPPVPAKRWPRRLLILRTLDGSVLGEDIPVARLDIDPAFLAVAIRHYVEHPEDRAAIGTAAESARREASFRLSTSVS